MKVLFISRGTTSHKMLEIFLDISEKVVFLAYEKWREHFYIEYNKLSEKPKNLEIIFTKSNLGYLKEILNLKNEKFDLIVANCPISSLFGKIASRIFKTRFINIMCSDFVKSASYSKDRFFTKKKNMFLINLMLKFGYHNSTVSCLSSYLKKRAINYGAKRVEIIPIYGVDTNYFKPAKPKKELIQKYKLKGKNVILWAGRMTPEKGFEYLVKAFPLIKKEIKNAKIVYIGEISTEKDFLELKKLLDSVGMVVDEDIVFIKMVKYDQMVDYYNISNVLAVTSFIEGLGFVSCEALSCEIPVAATNVGGVPDVVINNQTGILFPSKDPVALAETIIKILKDKKLAKKLASNGRKHMIKNFDSKVVKKKFIEFIKS